MTTEQSSRSKVRQWVRACRSQSYGRFDVTKWEASTR